MGTHYHQHDFFQFLYILKGQCRVTAEKKEIMLKKNQMMVFFPHVMHSLKYPELAEMFCEVIQLKLEMPKELLLLYKPPVFTDCSFFASETSNILFLIISFYLKSFLPEEERQMLITDGIIQLVDLLKTSNLPNFNNGPEGKIDRRIAEIAGEIDNTIKNYPGQEFSLTELSNRLALNKFYFSRLFKECFNMPPLTYVLNRKLEYAKSIMTHSGFNLKNIAKECGFNSYHHFSNLFLKRFGVRPKKFRQKIAI
ncbi:MAG: hypothetical protein A2096_16635 [Spirochaetes bacterium GWF1_41_5]|nr:MAG: hypothetical protein A2096_16635 [Spirochaetes bacterium GWF1_41_5]